MKHRIQCGNSLLGATPALLEKGIPDEAFEPIEGDDKLYCREAKKTNKRERQDWERGQGSIEDLLPHLGNFAAEMATLDTLPDDTADQVRTKAELYERLASESGYRTSGRFLADVWCAAFVWRKTKAFDFPITERIFRQVEGNPHDITPWMYDEVVRLREHYKFFHWHVAFPGVFRPPARGEKPDNELTGWCRGFDVVLGNPPWEHTEIKDKEWFAAHGRQDIADAPNEAARTRMITALATENPSLHAKFREDLRKADGVSHLVRNTGRYPLCGRGRINTYAIFAELNRNLIDLRGRVGCIVPSGIATDDTTKAFFQDLVDSRRLVSWFDFENRRGIFAEVDRTLKFCLLTLGNSPSFVCAAFLYDIGDLTRDEKLFTLSTTDLQLISPNTRTCCVFRSSRDADLTKGIYRRVPVLLRDEPKENPWRVSFKQGLFNMASDSKLFRTAEQLNATDWQLVGNVFHKGDDTYLPLYEAKLLPQFDHRWAAYVGPDVRDMTQEEKSDPRRHAIPRYWVPTSEVCERLNVRWNREWLLAWRDVTKPANERTTITSVLPRVGAGDTALLMLPAIEDSSLVALLLPSLNSFVQDYASRQKLGGTHLKYHVFKQLPILPPSTYAAACPWSPADTLAAWLLPRVVELTYTAWDLQPFAADCGFDGPPFRWDEDRRFQLRCELDADFARLKEAFSTPRHAVEYVMDTFPIVRQNDHGRYRTKERILELYDEMASGRPFVSPLPAAIRHEDESESGPPLDLFGDPLDQPTTEELVIQGFTDVRDGWSSEYVVCHPEYERRFHTRVGELASWLKPRLADANLTLWNALRSGKLTDLPRSKHHTTPKELVDYEFVCEWAYRSVIEGIIHDEKLSPKHTTLERILCNPEWRARLDERVNLLHPAFSLLDYRMLAMSIRKRAKSKLEATPTLFSESLSVEEATRKLPDQPGVYLIQSADEAQLYTGWTPNLREQAHRLVETGKGTIIPDWLLTGQAPPAKFAFEPLPVGTAVSVLQGHWLGNVLKGRPRLNLVEEALE